MWYDGETIVGSSRDSLGAICDPMMILAVRSWLLILYGTKAILVSTIMEKTGALQVTPPSTCGSGGPKSTM